MKIYVGHATSFDYKNELYAPIKNSDLWLQHEFVLPHDKNTEPFNSKLTISNSDLVIAVPILAIYKEGCISSSAIKIITDRIIPYNDLTLLLNQEIKTVKPQVAW